jgi:hypothetical protein
MRRAIPRVKAAASGSTVRFARGAPSSVRHAVNNGRPIGTVLAQENASFGVRRTIAVHRLPSTASASVFRKQRDKFIA